VDCVGSFSSFSTCSAACGSGTRTRVYSVTTAVAGTGAACPHASGFVETSACPNLPACPGSSEMMIFWGCCCCCLNILIHRAAVNCVGAFSSWTACTQTCGSQSSSRTFTVTTAVANGGQTCPFANGYTETQTCSLPACPGSNVLSEWMRDFFKSLTSPPAAVDCVGAFSAYSACTGTCGTAVRTRTFSITTSVANGGAACAFSHGYVETSVCAGLPACPGERPGLFFKTFIRLIITPLLPLTSQLRGRVRGLGHLFGCLRRRDTVTHVPHNRGGVQRGCHMHRG
jgi:hypothetical protein